MLIMREEDSGDEDYPIKVTSQWEVIEDPTAYHVDSANYPRNVTGDDILTDIAGRLDIDWV